MNENKQLELKEQVSNSFLKTVSAFANYGGGKIVFGVSDDGQTIGLANPEQDSLRIENSINDAFSPRPNFDISLNHRTKTLTLSVYESPDKPYLYRSKAYKRSGTSTVEVDNLELRRLLLGGANISFDELKASDQDLKFEVLTHELKEKVEIHSFDEDTLKTLGLYTEKDGFNNAAALLADLNSFHGIDIARFGKDINSILDRETHTNVSVLSQLRAALDLFDRYYRYEQIEGFERVEHERIPREAFREAVANALVHREWDIDAHIRILMFDDHVEVVSPGGLPQGVTEENYIAGTVSKLRNPVLGSVFHRLNIIEQFGTGIRRIRQSYAESPAKPYFSVYDESISVVLPVIDVVPELSQDESDVLDQFSSGRPLSSSEIVESSSFGKDKTLKLLKQLISKGLVRITGAGRATRYYLL